MHHVYDDETTFKLVAAASNVSGLPVETCLEEFGRHFLVYCQKNGYDQILRVLGSNLYDFLTNLDNLHDHLASIYPGMRAPSFRVTKQLEECSASVEERGKPLVPGDLPGAVGRDQREQNEQNHQRQQQQQAVGSMYLHYYSDRKGLSPIVKGLVMAVAKEFFSTDITVTECAQSRAKDDHVVLKIDRRSQAQISLDREASRAVEAAAAEAALHSAGEDQGKQEPEAEGEEGEQQLENRPTSRAPTSGVRQPKATMLSAAYGELLSKSASDSLINSEIMMQAFPFHVIFDRQFKLVQVGKSLLRATSSFWKRQQATSGAEPVKFGDLFAIVRPKIELAFEAIADHTNQVFVVRTKRQVLNADQEQVEEEVEAERPTSGAAGTAAAEPAWSSSSSLQAGPKCPFDRIARERLANRQRAEVAPHSGAESAAGELAPPPPHSGHEELAVNHKSLRLKGQMILLGPSDDSAAQLCLYLCSPRVDHLDQLRECGVNMSDFALHDRARELMLMSHTHKEDREAVKKLDQASNDLKKMDTKLRQENKRTNEVLHNIFPAKIAALLAHGSRVESESHELVSCLYSDIIGFTKMCGSENVRPIDIVRLLNTLYLQFDNLTNIHGVFKVETIGDAYVVVGGLPEPVADHADRCVRMGLDMVKVIATVRSPADNQPIQVSASAACFPLSCRPFINPPGRPPDRLAGHRSSGRPASRWRLSRMRLGCKRARARLIYSQQSARVNCWPSGARTMALRCARPASLRKRVIK